MTNIELLTAEDVCNIQNSTLSGVPSHNVGLIEGFVKQHIINYNLIIQSDWRINCQAHGMGSQYL